MIPRQLPLIQHVFHDYTAPWRNQSAPAVVLHPGPGGIERHYQALVPLLSDQYQVIRVTSRGQGGTPRPDDFERSLDNFVQDMMDVLDHLGIQKTH